MKIASTIHQVRETKHEAMAKINATTNKANNNGTNNTPNSNTAVAQSAATKTDTVEFSQKSVELAKTTQSEPKVEKENKDVKAEKAHDGRKEAEKSMRQSQRELSSLVKGLKKLGIGSREVGKIVRTANREANKTIGKEIKKAYDYRPHKIDKQSFQNKLYGAAVKKLDGIVSALRNTFDQKLASTEGKTVSTKPIKTPAPVEKAEENTEKVKEEANKTVAKTDDDDDDKKVAKEEEKAAKTTTTTTSELIVKEEKVVAEAEAVEGAKIVKNDGNADNAFSQIVDFFNSIDKLVNGFADGVEDDNVKDNGQSLVSFASKLNDMFSSINKAFGRNSDDNVGHKLGMAQIRKETISQMFDNGHGSGGAIHRISDAGEGSGNFNAVSFMSSLSNNINDALDNYKEVQKTVEKEADEQSKVVGMIA